MPIVTQPAELPKASAVAPVRQQSINVGEQGSPPTQEATSEKSISPQFAALARKEKALRRQQTEFEAAKKAFDAMKASSGTDLSGYVPKDRLKTEFWQVANEIGMTPDDLTKLFAEAPNQSDLTVQKLLTEVEALKQSQSQTKTQLEEKQKQEYEQAVSQIRTDAKLLVDSDDRFETIKALGQEEAIVSLIEETFNAGNGLLSIEEAASSIEDYLVEEAMKMSALNKVKQKMAPAAAVPQQKQSNFQKQPMQTLSHANTPSAKPMSKRERAIAAFKGQLK